MARGLECCTEQALKRPQPGGGGSRVTLAAAVKDEQRAGLEWGQVQLAEGTGRSRRHKDSVLGDLGRRWGVTVWGTLHQRHLTLKTKVGAHSEAWSVSQGQLLD